MAQWARCLLSKLEHLSLVFRIHKKTSCMAVNAQSQCWGCGDWRIPIDMFQANENPSLFFFFFFRIPVLKSQMVVPEKRRVRLNTGTPNHAHHLSCAHPSATTHNKQNTSLRLQTRLSVLGVVFETFHSRTVWGLPLLLVTLRMYRIIGKSLI